MTADDTIRILLMSGAKGNEPLEPAEWKRTAARVAWVRETMAKLRAAQRKADEAWMRLLAPFPDDVDDEELEALPPPPEQVEFDAIYAEIRAVIDEDRWPRELYYGCL